MPLDLDVLEPTHVVGHTVLKADLDIGGRHLLVASGFAIPAWEIDDDSTHRRVCSVRLRIPAGEVEQATVHVGLASIANGDTEYVFATDEAHVKVDAAGELVLFVHLALMGEPSALNRFSYQVVLITRVVVTEITGTISWPIAWYRPTLAGPAGVSGVFGVLANERTTTPGGPPFGGEVEHLRPITPGEIVSVTTVGDTCRAVYRISEPPMGSELKVTVAQNGLNGPGEISIVPVTQNFDRLLLSVAHPSRTGVDFVASSFVRPA